jgi:hypothetical protein
MRHAAKCTLTLDDLLTEKQQQFQKLEQEQQQEENFQVNLISSSVVLRRYL